MKLANILGIVAIVASVALAIPPKVERTTPTTIRVTGDYAFLDQGAPYSISNGVPIIDSIAWEDGGFVEYSVQADSNYTVHAFTFDEATPNEREMLSVTLQAVAPPEDTLDDIMYELTKAQRSIHEMLAAGEITNFDITESTQQAWIRLDAEEASLGDP